MLVTWVWGLSCHVVQGTREYARSKSGMLVGGGELSGVALAWLERGMSFQQVPKNVFLKNYTG